MENNPVFFGGFVKIRSFGRITAFDASNCINCASFDFCKLTSDAEGTTDIPGGKVYCAKDVLVFCPKPV